jgi:hypothetical protein
MARRTTPHRTAAQRRSVKNPQRADAANPWPHLQELIDNDGSISIGRVHPISCAAVANDEYSIYAMLVRRDNETLVELMTRLNHAVANALDEEIYIDEINKR